MNKLSIFIAIMTFALVSQAQTKQHVIKGQITSDTGTPVSEVKVVNPKDTAEKTMSDIHGLFTLFSKNPIQTLVLSKIGYPTLTAQIPSNSTFVNLAFKPALIEAEQINTVSTREVMMVEDLAIASAPNMMFKSHRKHSEAYNTESYSPINENGFHAVIDEPLSTFSIDVDRASYSNLRRFINGGSLPPVDAVRIEELINYFDYDYEGPTGDDPVRIYTEVTAAPWNKENYIMHIGLKAKELEKESLPASNLVFLLDVSGSMNSPNKLPLLQSAMKMLVGQLREDDRVAIVVYAGAAGLVLESTSDADKDEIFQAIDNLSAGGSTAGGAGIKLAYDVAQKHFIDGGNNRIILATDGDFNVGASSDGEMQRLIEEKREKGVYLTVLGFGMGNYKDSKMEILADKGNGNYAYIDNLLEAKKTLVNEFGATLFTVAKDVKLQVEFNPQNVAEYRLIGYENRMLNNEDFNDDTKDAGVMGTGHIVIALYEIVPAGKGGNSKVDPLRYTPSPKMKNPPFAEQYSSELATVKMRYKSPAGGSSKLISEIVQNDPVSDQFANDNIKWSTAVAGFGMLLRHSQYIKDFNYAQLIELAQSAIGKDKEGYRRECLQLMKSAELLEKNTASN